MRLFTVISGHSLGGSNPLFREAVGIFYRPSPPGHPGHSLGGSYPSAEKQSGYSTDAVDQAIRDTHSRSLTPPQRSSRDILQTQSTRPPGTLIRGVLPLRREAVGIFYRRSRPGHPGHSFEESYPSAEKQSGYSTDAVDQAIRDTHSRSLTPPQRSSRDILQTQSTRPSGTLIRGVLPLRREAVGIFYNHPPHPHPADWAGYSQCILTRPTRPRMVRLSEFYRLLI